MSLEDVFTEIRDNPLCLTCGLPKADHTPAMTENCAALDLTSLSANALSDPPRTGSGAESAPGRGSPPIAPRPGAPIVPQVHPEELAPCPNCGDDRPGKWRGECAKCHAVVCIWCSEGHTLGVHPTGRTLAWRDSDYWNAGDKEPTNEPTARPGAPIAPGVSGPPYNPDLDLITRVDKSQKPPGAPIAPGVSVASVLMGWANDVKRELEELGADGPVGSMIPYHLDPNTPAEDLVGLLVSLRGISGNEDSGLIGMLRDLSDDVAAALASIMDRKAETYAGMDVERHFGTARKNWDREAVAGEVTERTVGLLGDQLIDLVTGETKPVSAAAAIGADAVRKVFLKAFRLEPRAGALRALGVEPDKYCESEPGRPGVVVRVHKDTIE